MKFLRNPTTGQIRPAERLEARKLLRYGWTETTRDAYMAYKLALTQRAIAKAMPSLKRNPNLTVH